MKKMNEKNKINRNIQRVDTKSSKNGSIHK